MKKRPTSVTVIAWILLVVSALSLLASIMAINNPMAQELTAFSYVRRLQHILHILPTSQTTNLWQIHASIVCVLFLRGEACRSSVIWDRLNNQNISPLYFRVSINEQNES
jgi:hypothetical protein